MGVITWLAFLKALYPVLSEIARELYERFDGDPTKAIAELRRVHKHGDEYHATRTRNDQRMDALRDAERRAEVVTDADGSRHAVKVIGEERVRMPLKPEQPPAPHDPDKAWLEMRDAADATKPKPKE